jgi:putative Holliday junction resolvase
MRVLGLDIGDRRIGIALSDALGLTAQRLMVLERRNLSTDLEAIRALVATHHAERVVVGLPLTMRGERGVQAKKVAAFIDSLQRAVPVPVQPLDERLTTVQGQRALTAMNTSARKRKQLIDQVAAQLILQHFLDMQRSSAAPAA